jgi:signal transduction histidine kinase
MDRTVHWTDGRIVRFEMIVDITDRKRAEHELIASREKIRTIGDNLPGGLIFELEIAPGREPHFTYMSHQVERLHGVSIGDAIADADLVLRSVHDDDREIFAAILDPAQRENNEIDVKVRIRGIDGLTRWSRFVTRARHDGERTIVRGIEIDVTSQTFAEHTLAESIEELREINATKDRLFSIIAHDLRNPFMTLFSLLNIIDSDVDRLRPDELREVVASIRERTSSSYQLLENLLEWSRSQADGIAFHPQPISTRDVIETVVELFRHAAEQKSIDLTVELIEGCTMNADVDMINTVVRNLLSNAVKFTERGGTVRIGASSDNGECVITVRDSGIGIAARDLEALFDVRHASRTLGTDNERGAGLGLLVCDDFVKRHGGRIEVESTVGAGTTFRVRIPTALE